MLQAVGTRLDATQKLFAGMTPQPRFGMSAGVGDALIDSVHFGAARVKTPAQLLKDLDAVLGEARRYNYLGALASWDQETEMPEEGIARNAEAQEMLAEKTHALMTSARLGHILDGLKQPAVLSRLSAIDQKRVTALAEDYAVQKAMPKALVKEMASLFPQSSQKWAEARAKGDFSIFQPYLERVVALTRQQAEVIAKVKGYPAGDKSHPLYDMLLDQYEPGMTTAKLDKLFGDLREQLVPLVHAISQAQAPDASFMIAGISEARQQNFSDWIAGKMGFDFNRGGIKKSVHPFTMGIAGPDDTRFTRRFNKRELWKMVIATMHECGHALYEQGINKTLPMPFDEAKSLGIHESQSRSWENNVGKSRAFLSFLLPELQKRFPSQFKDVSLDQLEKAVNKVDPSFIRVEADEVTYNLHVMVRYELEKALLDGTLEVKDLPKAWNEKMKDYLGVEPPNDSLGVLQDVHWSAGMLGYFPTYTLGNLYAAQFIRQAHQEIPDLDAEIEKGDLLPLKNWLNRKIHQVGSSENAEEIATRVTGEGLNAKYFVDYLWEKYGRLYNIERPKTA